MAPQPRIPIIAGPGSGISGHFSAVKGGRDLLHFVTNPYRPFVLFDSTVCFLSFTINVFSFKPQSKSKSFLSTMCLETLFFLSDSLNENLNKLSFDCIFDDGSLLFGVCVCRHAGLLPFDKETQKNFGVPSIDFGCISWMLQKERFPISLLFLGILFSSCTAI